MSGITGISSPTGKPYNDKPSKPPSSGITGVSGPKTRNRLHQLLSIYILFSLFVL